MGFCLQKSNEKLGAFRFAKSHLFHNFFVEERRSFKIKDRRYQLINSFDWFPIFHHAVKTAHLAFANGQQATGSEVHIGELHRQHVRWCSLVFSQRTSLHCSDKKDRAKGNVGNYHSFHVPLLKIS